MSKEELKKLYKLKKISAAEYFLKLGQILKDEMPVSKSPVKNDLDIISIFDGELPLFTK